MNKKQVIECQNLTNDIDEILTGHDLDAVIPALTMNLSVAVIMSGMDRETLLSFVAATFDTVYENKEHILGDLQ